MHVSVGLVTRMPKPSAPCITRWLCARLRDRSLLAIYNQEMATTRRSKQARQTGNWIGRLRNRYLSRHFSGSATYWESRYVAGRNSGAGSYGELATFKANFINDFVAGSGVSSVIEYGCGDGNQLALAEYPSYIGFDVSTTAIELCRSKFQNDLTKRFELSEDFGGEVGDLTLSLDVIYHLIEDDVFHSYMELLFRTSRRFVIV